jgi:hypothetical protein
MLYLKPFDRRKKKTDDNQAFFTKKSKSLTQIGFFFASLVTAGDLKYWRKVQPWISLVTWFEDVFDGECLNAPRCRGGNTILGTQLCAACALQKAEETFSTDRSTCSVASDPSGTFRRLIRDIVRGADVTWWTRSIHVLKRTVIKTSDMRIFDRFSNGLIKIVPTNFNYYVDSCITFDSAVLREFSNITVPELDTGVGVVYSWDGRRYCPPSLYTGSYATEDIRDLLEDLQKSAPMGVSQMVIVLVDDNSGSKDSIDWSDSNDCGWEYTYRVYWVLPKDDDDVVTESIRDWFTDSALARHFPSKNYLYAIISVLLLALALYLNKKRLESLMDWCQDK